MSELSAFADHARAMSTAAHRLDCGARQPEPRVWPRWVHPDPACGGCVTDAERELWCRLAEECAAWFARNDDDAETLI